MAENKRKKPKMDKRKLLVGIMAGFMALLLVLPMIAMLFTTVAGAASASSIRSELQTLKAKDADLAAQKTNFEAELAQIRDEKALAVDKKQILEQQVGVIQDQIKNLNNQITQYDVLIAEKQDEVVQAKGREAEQYALFCQRARAMEEEGTVSYWSILFSASSFGDLLDRVNFVSEIMEWDNAVIAELEATRLALEQARVDLESAQAEVEAAKVAQEAARAELKVKEQAVATELSNIKSNEYETEAALAKIAAAAAEMDTAIAKREKELLALLAADKNTIKFDPGSGFQWPLPARYVSVTSFSGGRNHPITGKWHTHTGTDIGVPGGVDIYSAHGGVVLTSAYNSSYGNYVVVSRGDGISTLYAHMSRRAVSEGDVVTQGQTVGYVGSTGSSTGNHLHFELRVNGARVDALQYFTNVPWVNNTGFSY